MSGCDVWTLARSAGHSSAKMAERYVHPSHEAVIEALEKMPHVKELSAAMEQKTSSRTG